MGKDLYWKKTPKVEEEIHASVWMSTWNLLSDLFDCDDREDLDGKILDKSNLPQLLAIKLAAEASNNNDLCKDTESLIRGIEDYGSITLNVIN